MKKLMMLGLLAVTMVSTQLIAAETPLKPEMAAQAASAQMAKPININTASVEELQLLKGVGEAKAKAIVEYRLVNGKFKSIDELTQVSGIGEKLLEQNRSALVL